MRKIYRIPRIFRSIALLLLIASASHLPAASAATAAAAASNPPARAAAPAPAAAATPATAQASSQAAAAAAASGASAPLATRALVSNGLIAQLVYQSSRWGHVAAEQSKHAATLWRGFASFGSGWQQITRTAGQRAALWTLCWQAAAVMLLALAGDALLSWALKRPRNIVAQRAHRAELATRQNDAIEISRIPAANQADAALSAAASKEAGLVQEPDRNETEAPAQAGAVAANPAPDPALADARDAATAASAGTAEEKAAAAESTAQQIRGARSAANHWRLLQRLPYMLAHFVLTLLPPIAFFLIATSVPSFWIDDSGSTQDVLDTLVNAYLVVRTVLVIVRLFIAPRTPALRLLHMNDSVALHLEAWVRWIVGVVAFGNALADIATTLDLSPALHDAISRLAVLIGHLLLAAMVLRYRRTVAGAIRSWTSYRPSLAMLGHWLADIWAFAALFLIMALWFVWATDVKNGLEQVFNLFGQAIAVLAVARVVAIVLLGGLSRLFHTEDPSKLRPASRRALRYYPLLRRLVSLLISAIALIVILQVLGMNAWQWILSGSIGKNLLSACVTVGVSCAIAMLIWEATNAVIERRLERWNSDEDRVRAARLRTLLPMLRSVLFIVIALIVGLTALNQIGVNTAPLMASASIIGVALGFGSQKLVQDFITGIFLLMENAMQVGDWVTVAGVSGTVEYLSIRTVRLRGGDGSLYTVPFSSVTTVNNTNRGIGNAAVKVNVAADEDLDRIVTVLQQIGAAMREDPEFGSAMLADFEYWGVDTVDGAMVSISGQIRSRDSGRWKVQREFNRRMLLRFRELGIRFSDSQRTLLVRATTDAESGQPGAPLPQETTAAHSGTASADPRDSSALSPDSSAQPSAQSASSGDNKPPK